MRRSAPTDLQPPDSATGVPPSRVILQKPASSRELFYWCLWGMPLLAVLIGFFLLVVQHAHFSYAGRSFFSSIVYSVVIGVPSAVLLNWIGIRYSERSPRIALLLNAIALLATATIGALVAGLLFLAVGFEKRWDYWLEVKGALPTCYVISLLVGLGISSFETMRHKLQYATLELRTRQIEQERANKLLAEARLSSLESRIHPHFLFNTLNSIASLIPSDPRKAEDTVGKLASLLRFSLNANHSSLVPLAQEMKIVRAYLEIESTRFGPRLQYTIDVPEALGSTQLPPLALQTLVENSLKHVVAKRTGDVTLRVAGTRDNGLVRLSVIDDGPGFSIETISAEHGLGNLATRLQLLFGERSELNVAHENGRTTVCISFPAEN